VQPDKGGTHKVAAEFNSKAEVIEAVLCGNEAEQRQWARLAPMPSVEELKAAREKSRREPRAGQARRSHPRRSQGRGQMRLLAGSTDRVSSLTMHAAVARRFIRSRAGNICVFRCIGVRLNSTLKLGRWPGTSTRISPDASMRFAGIEPRGGPRNRRLNVRFAPKATQRRVAAKRRYVPLTEVGVLFDHLVGE
jgi:hypothetical protein